MSDFPYYTPDSDTLSGDVSPDGVPLDDVSPDTVSLPVPHHVSPGVAPSLSRDVSPGVPLDDEDGRPEDGFPSGWDTGRGNAEGNAAGPSRWLPSEWVTEQADPEPPVHKPRQRKPGIGGRIANSRLGLEVRHPRPEGWDQHRAHILGHPRRPDGWPGIAWALGYASFTYPVKGTGKAVTAFGKFCVTVGPRIDAAGNRFAYVAVPVAFLIVLALVIIQFA
jgi:hypothetical protein